MNLLRSLVMLNKHTSTDNSLQGSLGPTDVKLTSTLTNSVTTLDLKTNKQKNPPVSLTATYWLFSAVEIQVET